tara:strand:- start:7535 stop:7996 length:462 start_codon:yes stop_codon:yes gene_type:complete
MINVELKQARILRAKELRKKNQLSYNKYQKFYRREGYINKKNLSEKQLQEKFRKIEFGYSQYWLVEYSEIKDSGKYNKLKCIIIARSYSFAEVILRRKLEEDKVNSKLTNLKISMIHKNSKLNGQRLSVSLWQDVRQCAFPNKLNILFKYHGS